MLVRAVRPSFEGFQDTAKQLLIWALNKRNHFGTYNYDYYSQNRVQKPWGRQKKWQMDDHFDKEEKFEFDEELKPVVKDFYKFHPNVVNRLVLENFSNSIFPRGINCHFPLMNSVRVTPVEDKSAFESGFCFCYRHRPRKLKPTTDKALNNLQERSKEAVTEFWNKHDIKIFGKGKDSCPPPILSFDELNLPNEIYNVVRYLKYSQPTPVQSQTWPLALAGHNMVGISRTGSGKTFGFVLPALFHINHQEPVKENEGPIVLIIAPTRELVQQIMGVIMPFEKALSLRTAGLFGGVSKIPQMHTLNRGTEICVATPGRLIDLLKENVLTLSRCTYCVLDEADRLLDMGFEPQIRAIMNRSRADKQILMWSATWPKEVRNLAECFLVNYVGVQFGSVECAANPNITQHIHVCEERKKPSLLKEILTEINQSDDNKTIIFVQTKIKAETIALMLKRFGFSAVAIHGDKSQAERDRCLRLFRNGRIKILVGTLVVGRGLDITDIRYVINYDFPTAIEDYVHVIGRTARNESTGVSHTFFTLADSHLAPGLVRVLQEANQEVQPELLRMSKYGRQNERVKRFGINLNLKDRNDSRF